MAQTCCYTKLFKEGLAEVLFGFERIPGVIVVTRTCKENGRVLFCCFMRLWMALANVRKFEEECQDVSP